MIGFDRQNGTERNYNPDHRNYGARNYPNERNDIESESRYMPRRNSEYPEMRMGNYPSGGYGYPMQNRAGNEYGDIYAHGTIWAPNAMNKPSNSMRDEEGASMEVDEHKARDWVKRMSGGEHFKLEQAEQQRTTICPNCDKWEFYAAINAMYSDYGKTAQKMGLDRPDFYAMLARDFLMDDDAKPHKLARYMMEIAK